MIQFVNFKMRNQSVLQNFSREKKKESLKKKANKIHSSVWSLSGKYKAIIRENYNKNQRNPILHHYFVLEWHRIEANIQ